MVEQDRATEDRAAIIRHAKLILKGFDIPESSVRELGGFLTFNFREVGRLVQLAGGRVVIKSFSRKLLTDDFRNMNTLLQSRSGLDAPEDEVVDVLAEGGFETDPAMDIVVQGGSFDQRLALAVILSAQPKEYINSVRGIPEEPVVISLADSNPS